MKILVPPVFFLNYTKEILEICRNKIIKLFIILGTSMCRKVLEGELMTHA